ncbi:MAG: efflux RND transporter periplasmic adaptor subunit [Bacteroidetes bacterium]|nr:MAG: efflux RND transporter periplasmic adaptor subunit [Bacteroidota bacterium]REK06647.1 MAG: efflux RND transporter periplasmic adaptor subunit [Bacteroidota bacterium]REK33413.1 MAG: efflux RND transporter periplasmic adaptor subunit [Bacteroidota bacterium]REK49812.1 MAG: efflux RND transporter periplasmic adaptor subunit [Bacteroidota bacterium]
MNKVLFTLFIIQSALFYSCGKKENSASPEYREIIHAVYASGKVLPQNHYQVFSKFPGYVIQVHVESGQVINAGAPLISIKNEMNEYSIANARNQYKLAEENADEKGSMMIALKQEVESARSKFLLDSINYIRNKSLIEKQAVSKSTFDQSETQYAISKHNYRRAAENFSVAKNRLQVEKLNAYNQLQSLISAKGDYDIHSLINGKIYDVNADPGGLVSSIKPLFDIGDASEYEAELEIDETDISFIKEGQKVVYSIDAYRDRNFSGVITRIYPKVNALTKTCRVTATFENPDSLSLFSGLSLEANIVIEEGKKALVIPREFVRSGNQVMVKGEDKPRTIVKGIEDLEYVEVISGIDEHVTLVRF